jgi:hypothetical protein
MLWSPKGMPNYYFMSKYCKRPECFTAEPTTYDITIEWEYKQLPTDDNGFLSKHTHWGYDYDKVKAAFKTLPNNNYDANPYYIHPYTKNRIELDRVIPGFLYVYDENDIGNKKHTPPQKELIKRINAMSHNFWNEIQSIHYARCLSTLKDSDGAPMAFDKTCPQDLTSWLSKLSMTDTDPLLKTFKENISPLLKEYVLFYILN